MTIIFELTGPTATLVGNSVIKAGSQVPVTISLTTNGQPAQPAGTPTIGMGITAQTTSPSTLAFLNTFTALTPNTFTGIFNANDTRLVAFFAALASAQMNLEVSVTIEGEDYWRGDWG
jgi:hypothetical protein